MKGAELFPPLRSSAADVVNGAPSGCNVREYPLANIILPFTSPKADAVALAWNKLYAQNADFRGEFESKGAKILYAGPWAENSVWSRRQIAKIEAFKGIKIRAVPPISRRIRVSGFHTYCTNRLLNFVPADSLRGI